MLVALETDYKIAIDNFKERVFGACKVSRRVRYNAKASRAATLEPRNAKAWLLLLELLSNCLEQCRLGELRSERRPLDYRSILLPSWFYAERGDDYKVPELNLKCLLSIAGTQSRLSARGVKFTSLVHQHKPQALMHATSYISAKQYNSAKQYQPPVQTT